MEEDKDECDYRHLRQLPLADNELAMPRLTTYCLSIPFVPPVKHFYMHVVSFT